VLLIDVAIVIFIIFVVAFHDFFIAQSSGLMTLSPQERGATQEVTGYGCLFVMVFMNTALYN
jgi:hypothetical protein